MVNMGASGCYFEVQSVTGRAQAAFPPIMGFVHFPILCWSRSTMDKRWGYVLVPCNKSLS